jgi:CRP/FNR family transcriptional regulator
MLTLDDFFSQYEHTVFPKGTVIINAEDNPRGVYFIKSGHVREYGMSTQGTEVTIHVFNTNSFFPLIWALNATPNRYYFETVTETEVYIAPAAALIKFLEEHPDILMTLTKRLLSGLDKMSSRLEFLTTDKAYNRLISILLYLGRHFGKKEEDGSITIGSMTTHQDIASIAGLSRETVSREWEKLKARNLVISAKKSIVIPDMTALEEELN